MTACPLCDAQRDRLERMTQLDRWFCNGCGHIFVVGEHGVVLQWQRTQRTRTATRKVRRYEPYISATPALNPPRVSERKS